jgi:hypothetical protein
MADDQQDSVSSRLQSLVLAIVDLPIANIFSDLWKIGQKIIRALSVEGVYEVLEYESTLELKDNKGQKAVFQKREIVKYLQDYVLTYQDQAWGDGDILIGYRCTPGVPVDRYREGFKTHILISLQEVKNKGDIEEFNIRWAIKNGFLNHKGFWGTEISHRTKRAKVIIIFPRNRHPKVISVYEKNKQKSQSIGQSAIAILPDGRRLFKWEKSQPRLHEQYIINWEW